MDTSSRMQMAGALSCMLALAFVVGCGDTTVGPPPPPTDTGTPPPDDGAPPPDPPPPVAGSLAAVTISDGAGETWRVTGEIESAADDLVSVTGHSAFWFAWSVFHPGTSIFDRDADIADASIASSAECTVPCDQIAPACGGRDCIPSLQSPTMVPADSGEISYLRDTDDVVGVLTSEGPRAYPHPILYWHEIINEAVGGDSFAVTLCPLTGSGLLYDRSGFVPGSVVELGVSGSLYNSNLVMYDRTSESFWSQMRNEAAFGSRLGAEAPLLPVLEMTWGAWRELYPDTLVVSGNTGHSRDYTAYPYGPYRTDDSNTFRRTDPAPDAIFANKDMTFGIFVGGEVRAYVWDVLATNAGARRGLVQDELGGVPVAIVFDLDARYVHAFDRRVGGEIRDLVLVNP